MGYLLVANATQIRLSFRIYILMIHMIKFTIICNILCYMTQNFHNNVINSFVKSLRNLLPIRIQTSILHSKTYTEAGSIWLHLRNLWNNIILSMPYTFDMTLRSCYGTRYLTILVINNYTMLTNILMESKVLVTLLLEYLINAPLSSNLICPKLHLAMGTLVLPQNHIRAPRLLLPSMGWPPITVTKRLSTK